MKIKPIFLLPVLLVFVISLAWSKFSTTEAAWRDSYYKLEKCRQLEKNIQTLRTESARAMQITPEEFDFREVFREKLIEAKVESQTTPTSPTSIDEVSQTHVEKFQFETRWSEITLRELIQLLAVTTAPNNDIFAQQIRLVAPSENPSRSTEKWDANIVWNYFQAE